MNLIVPHGPPVQTAPSKQPASPDGQGGGGSSFDDLMPDGSSTGTTTPIAGNPPSPSDPRDPRTPDPMTPILHRPMFWKGGKKPVDPSSTDAAAATVQLQSQVDLKTLTLPVGEPLPWSPPPPLPEDGASSSGDNGSIQDAPPVDATGGGAIPAASVGSLPSPVMASGQAIDVMSAPVVAGTASTLPAAYTASPNVNPVLPAPSLSPIADSRQAVASAAPDLPAVAPASDVSFGFSVPRPADVLAMPPGTDPLIVAPPDPRQADAAVISASPSATAPSVVASSSPLDVFTLPPVADLRIAAQSTPISTASAASSTVTAGSLAAPLMTATNPLPPVPTAAASAAIPLSSLPTAAVETSAVLPGRTAKIADSASREIKSVRGLKNQELQTTANEEVSAKFETGGTPVAKDEAVVNATLSTNEKEVAASPLPKRDGADSAGVVAPGRTVSNALQGRETLVAMAVSGPANAGATSSQVTETATVASTASQQVVKVETLLQNALSTGESIRPNGNGQMEMRVSLGGGAEDVTVRMQVTDDRMQVTFQTNSPELQKALEHGWTQFSADAAQTSTLALAQPRFETAPASYAAPSSQADTASFSSNQQNPRGQDAPTPDADEPVSADRSRRAGFAPNAAAMAAGGQRAGGRWSGWA